jgi:class 3 adenylate cyclase
VRTETRYARSGDVHIAYEVLGEGAVDLVYVPEFWNSMEAMWEEPRFERFLLRLATFSRLVIFDNRGSGLSDPVPLDHLPTLEVFMDDVRAVMDAAGLERGALFSSGGGGMVSLMFAATFPQRTTALVFANSYSRLSRAPDYEWGVPVPDPLLTRMEQGWGTGTLLHDVAPTAANEPGFREWWARYERLGLSPGAAVAMRRMLLEADARHLLPLVKVPTLVLHRTGNRLIPPEHGRYLGKRIPGARYLELSGSDHLLFLGDTDEMLDEIQEFLTGTRPGPQPDRVLATVLFTDIVASTERASELGDRRWRDLLDLHDRMVRRQLDRFRGWEVKTTGDGFMATFDGPARGVRCAAAIRDGARQLDLEVRAGLHTGECEIRGDDVVGVAVHIASRVMGTAEPGTVLVSSTVKELVAGSGIEFADRGIHALKGLEEEWHLYEVIG